MAAAYVMAIITGAGAATARANIDAAAMTNGAAVKAVALTLFRCLILKRCSAQAVAVNVVKAMAALTGAAMTA